MATIYYTAASLDGFVVDDDGSLDWLTARRSDAGGPFAVEAFGESVAAVVMGATTYEWIVAHEPGDWPYRQPSWVITHRPEIVAAHHPVQTFDGDVADLHPVVVAAAGGGDVWLVGGGQVAAQFAAAGLIDELIVAYAPCTLGRGAPVLPTRSQWRLVDSAVNGDFVCARWAAATPTRSGVDAG